MALLLSGGCGGARCSTVPAPAPAVSLRVGPVGVLQKELRLEQMFFHPTMAIVGQLDDDRCDVWDLFAGAYRGAIAARDCRDWMPPSEAGSSATANEIVARSSEGARTAMGRKGASSFRLEVSSGTAGGRRVVLPDAADRLDDLVWTRDGKLCTVSFPSGVLLWDPTEVELPSRKLIDVDGLTGVWLDHWGRWVGFAAESTHAHANSRTAGVISLSSKRPVPVLESFVLDDDRAVTKLAAVAWAPEVLAVVAIKSTAVPFSTCNDANLTIEYADLSGGRQAISDLGRSQLTYLAVAPDGERVLVATADLRVCNDQLPGGPARHTPVVRLWNPGGHRNDWEARLRSSAAVWAPSSRSVAIAGGGRIEIFGVGTPMHLSSFAGEMPIVWSPDSRRVGFMNGTAFYVRDVAGGELERRLDGGVIFAAWGAGGVIALAHVGEVALWDDKTLAVRASIPVSGVARIEWDRAGRALALATNDLRVLVVSPYEGGVPVELGGILGDRGIAWMPDGSLVLLDATQAHRFGLKGRAWEQTASARILDPRNVDPSGRFELVDGGTVTRVDDGEVLHLDPYERQGLWTESHVFAVAPPPGWVFRVGPDVLAGSLIRVKDATFLRPTPDLAQLFTSGAKLSALDAR